MALTDNQQQEGRVYLYRKCRACGAKMHIESHNCLKCGASFWQNALTGKWKDGCYGSQNPEDAVYSKDMNNAGICMQCVNVLKYGDICKPAVCFGVRDVRGGGSMRPCGECREFNETRFNCCQEVQKKEAAAEFKSFFKK
jgi:ribosomal protein L40E